MSLIQKHLELFDMSLTTNSLTGLVKVKYDINGKFDFNAYNKNEVSAKELFALEKAAVYKVHFVYFRKFPNRPSIPQIYIFDYTLKTTVDKEEITELHRKLYSAVQVPMFFVFTSTEVSIFNCFEQPEKKGEIVYKPLETIKLATDLFGAIKSNSKTHQNIKAFSGKLFDNGSFWENSKYSKKFSVSNSAYEKLLKELKNALDELINVLKIPKPIAKKLLVMGILIRYLEERTDKKERTVFPKKGEKRKKRDKRGRRRDVVYNTNFFEEFAPNAETFIDVLKAKTENNLKHPVLNLFKYLGGHFNGEFFKFSESELNEVKKLNDYVFNYLGAFFNGELEGKQYVIWKLYSFKDLPIELISNIYEAFLESKKGGVVYTPPFLVELLLDESMPVTDTKTNIKILDPACGSGIFLVGAYKRLIQRWRLKNDWNNPRLNTLKNLLKNIHGVDIKDEAVRLSIFSLNIALCDELSPVEIWDELEFDSLYDNQIYSKDFFQLLLDKENDKELQKDFSNFDLVIGNPPFVSKLSKAAKEIEAKAKEKRIIEIDNKNSKIDLPDKQIALLFLEQSINLCKENGWTTLIMPAGPLLYNQGASNFRNTFFSKYHIPQIFDFTALNSTLFQNANVAATTIFIQKKAVERKGIYHIAFRAIKQNKEKVYLELDNYDFHYTPLNLAIKDSFIWKANFLGGGRIYHLLKYIRNLRSLGSFLKEKEKNYGWVIGEGFKATVKSDEKNLSIIKKLSNQKNLSSKERNELNKLLERYKAKFISEKRILPVEKFYSKGIDNSKIYFPHEFKYFHSKGKPEIYKKPHLLIKEVVETATSCIPIEFRNDDLVFKNSIIGIHVPNESDIPQLKAIEERFKDEKAYAFYLAGVSGRYMINKASSLLKSDIDSLPYPEDKSDIELNDIENVIVNDFLEYLLPFRRVGINSKAVKPATKSDLENFATYYCKVLNSVYKNLKPYGYLETESFICYAFYFGDEKPTIDFGNPQEAEASLEKLVYNTTKQHLKITRVVRVYENNAIYLIKPKQVRYWLRSVAVRDADDTFSDLRKQGY